ncbi:DoxX family membrane protein [soil metagenome]
MRILRSILAILFGISLIVAAINHFIRPEFYYALTPDYLPKLLVSYVAGIVELILGVGVLIPKYRPRFGLGIMILMCLFLPVHVWDVVRDHPAVGSHTAAMVRLLLQFVLIYWAWFISKK